MSETIPNPGSADARARGCKCDMLRNAYGKGAFTTSNGRTRFVVASLCPLHGIESGWRQE